MISQFSQRPARLAQRLHVVAHMRDRLRHDAESFEQTADAVAIAVVDLAVTERFAGRHQLIAGDEQRDARSERNLHFRKTARGKQTESCRAQRLTRAHRDFAAGKILAGAAHVRAGRLTCRDDDELAIDAHVLLHDDRVGAVRQRGAGRDAHALVGVDARRRRAAGEHDSTQPKLFFAIARQIRAA